VESRSGEGFAAQPQVKEDPANPPSRNKPRRAEVPQAPLVQRVIEACEAQLVYVDEGFGAPAAPLTDRTEDEEA